MESVGLPGKHWVPIWIVENAWRHSGEPSQAGILCTSWDDQSNATLCLLAHVRWAVSKCSPEAQFGPWFLSVSCPVTRADIRPAHQPGLWNSRTYCLLKKDWPSKWVEKASLGKEYIFPEFSSPLSVFPIINRNFLKEQDASTKGKQFYHDFHSLSWIIIKSSSPGRDRKIK